MIQVKGRCYFISEKLIKALFKEDDKYFVRLKSGAILEIDEMTYYNQGGK